MRRTTLPLLAAALFCATGCMRAEPDLRPDPQTRRDTPQGPLIGGLGGAGNHEWRGIPFARPPVGPLRWRAPRAPEPWVGELSALAHPPGCPQLVPSRAGGGPQLDEDCLRLDVYAPAFAPGEIPAGDARRPVMVWIHGGGNTVGSAGMYDGGQLAARHGVIVVAVQYRLGPFGWLRHAALRGPDTDADDRSGNFGTLDLVQSLRWVRDSISAFGGDPGNVTIFGESAGGRNVYSLLLSPRATGLYHRAISQSGALGTSTLAEAENRADAAEPGHVNSSTEVLARLWQTHGGAPDREAAQVAIEARPSRELAAFLRERTPLEILNAYAGGSGLGMIDLPRLFGDGHVLRAAPQLEQLASGHHADVPVIVGANRDESKLFMALDRRYTRFLWRLPTRPRDARIYERDAQWRSSVWRLAAVDRPARAMAAARPGQVWAYRFDWDESPRRLGLVDLPRLLGAAHALEIAFVLGDFDAPPFSVAYAGRPSERALSDVMMSYWAEFAWRGDPGRGRDGSLAPWSPWSETPGAGRFVVFDTPADGGVRMASDALTSRGVVDAIAADARFDSDAGRCTLLAELQEWRGALDPGQVRGLCGAP